MQCSVFNTEFCISRLCLGSAVLLSYLFRVLWAAIKFGVLFVLKTKNLRISHLQYSIELGFSFFLFFFKILLHWKLINLTRLFLHELRGRLFMSQNLKMGRVGMAQRMSPEPQLPQPFLVAPDVLRRAGHRGRITS